MYCEINFKTKKELKEAVKGGRKIGVFQPNDMFGNTEKVQKGKHTVYLEGPHYPKPHSWYAQAEVENGIITKVK